MKASYATALFTLLYFGVGIFIIYFFRKRHTGRFGGQGYKFPAIVYFISIPIIIAIGTDFFSNYDPAAIYSFDMGLGLWGGVILFGIVPTVVYIAVGLYILSLEHIKKRPGYKLPALIYFISVPSLIVIAITLHFSMNYLTGAFERTLGPKPTGYHLYKFLVLKDIIPRSGQSLDKAKTTETAEVIETESTETAKKVAERKNIINLIFCKNNGGDTRYKEEVFLKNQFGGQCPSSYPEEITYEYYKKSKTFHYNICYVKNTIVAVPGSCINVLQAPGTGKTLKYDYDKKNFYYLEKRAETQMAQKETIQYINGFECTNKNYNTKSNIILDLDKSIVYFDKDNSKKFSIFKIIKTTDKIIVFKPDEDYGYFDLIYNGIGKILATSNSDALYYAAKLNHPRKYPVYAKCYDVQFAKTEVTPMLNVAEGKTTLAKFATDEKYYALIIGNNNYEHLEKLDAAENDAKVLANVLQDKYGFEVELLLNGDYSTTVDSIFNMTNKLKKNDNLLIYYAGHGELDKAENRGYWLPVDASNKSRAEWISNTRIVDRIKATKAKHVLLMVDSCFSGTLMRSGTTPAVKEIIDEKYIERLKKKKTRLVITSGGNEPVVDSDGGQHSLFALKLIDTLKNNNSVINSQILFENIRRYVVSNADQTPERAMVHKTGHDGGDFLFFAKN